MTVQQGLIAKIERFSLHDGPGIRTLIVTKGCPLKCRWCSSPYTQSAKPEVLYIASRCLGCGACGTACPSQAITRDDASASVKTDRAVCIGCGACVSACPNSARELCGRYYTPEALFSEVAKDEAFYRRSGGGVTIGGGEPSMQAGFVRAFLSLCQSHLMHTAMETCAQAPWETFAPLLDGLDLVYIDLKHMDAKRHLEWTGVSNRIILENMQKAARQNDMIVRIPVIPGFNDDDDNIAKSAAFIQSLGNRVLRLELLPYHLLGISHYAELDRDDALSALAPPAEKHMERLCGIAESFGIETEIGG